MNSVDGIHLERLKKLISTLDDNEADLFVSWILENLDNLGFQHGVMCALYRPHSHSADCDCGGEETGYKINRIILGE